MGIRTRRDMDVGLVVFEDALGLDLFFFFLLCFFLDACRDFYVGGQGVSSSSDDKESSSMSIFLWSTIEEWRRSPLVINPM